ncbi:MAG: hypothetical protein ABIT37_10395 [Luteolibacter sp.]
MKELLYFLGLVAAGALGYKFEPKLRSQLAAAPPAVEVIEETVVIEAGGPSAPTAEPAIDLAGLAPSQLPEKILLKTAAKVADSSSGVIMSVDAGTHVKPVRIEGENVIFSPGAGSFVGKVAISDTDLLAQLAAKPPSPVVPVEETPVAPVPMPEAAAPVTGDSQEPPAEVTPAPTPAPEAPPMEEATPAPAAEPAPAPAPETPAAPAAAGSSDVVTAMQQSIKAAQIKEFTFEQVLNWEAGADETVDGETYQTGLASYKAETIFGMKTIQAKALLKAGKVQRWIWPKSGMEIK